METEKTKLIWNDQGYLRFFHSVGITAFGCGGAGAPNRPLGESCLSDEVVQKVRQRRSRCSKSSTYSHRTPRTFRYLRPCWRSFLNNLESEFSRHLIRGVGGGTRKRMESFFTILWRGADGRKWFWALLPKQKACPESVEGGLVVRERNPATYFEEGFLAGGDC